MDKQKAKKYACTAINLAFFVFVMLVLLAGLVLTLFFPSEINEYENRKAEKLSRLSLDSYSDGSFQNSTEKALADNILLSISLVQGNGSHTSAQFALALGVNVLSVADVYVAGHTCIVQGKCLLLSLAQKCPF